VSVNTTDGRVRSPRHQGLLGLDGERPPRKASPRRRPAALAPLPTPRTPPEPAGCAPPRAAGRAPRPRARRAPRRARGFARCGRTRRAGDPPRAGTQRSMTGSTKAATPSPTPIAVSGASGPNASATAPVMNPMHAAKVRRAKGPRLRRGGVGVSDDETDDVGRDPEAPGEQRAVPGARERPRDGGEGEGGDSEGGVDPAGALDGRRRALERREVQQRGDGGGGSARARGAPGNQWVAPGHRPAVPRTATNRPGSAARRSDAVRMGCAKASTVESPSSSPEARGVGDAQRRGGRTEGRCSREALRRWSRRAPSSSRAARRDPSRRGCGRG
jgi:hypothetical protein